MVWGSGLVQCPSMFRLCFATSPLWSREIPSLFNLSLLSFGIHFFVIFHQPGQISPLYPSSYFSLLMDTEVCWPGLFLPSAAWLLSALDYYKKQEQLNQFKILFCLQNVCVTITTTVSSCRTQIIYPGFRIVIHFQWSERCNSLYTV